MKPTIWIAAIIFIIGCSSSNNQKSDTEIASDTAAEATVDEAVEDSTAELKQAIMGDEPLRAFELLQNSNIDNSLQISDKIWMWYETEPFFKSWLVSAGKIKEGPEYHYVVNLKQTELLETNSNKEVLIHSSQYPYVNIDGYVFNGSADYLSFSKILETSYAVSDEEQNRIIQIDLNDRDYGIPDDFDIINDRFEVLYSSKYYRIPKDVLSNEDKPFNIASYFKFYSKDLEEAERVLTTEYDSNAFPGAADGDYRDQLEILDLKGGYMKVVTPVQDGFRYTEYVYWNLSGGKKLFGKNHVTMEPFTGEVTTDSYEFKVFNRDQWEPADVGFLKELTQEIRTKKADALVNSQVLTSVFDLPKEITPETHFNYRMSLPQKGKDIQFWLNYNEGAEVVSEQEVLLKFNDGKFEYQPN